MFFPTMAGIMVARPMHGATILTDTSGREMPLPLSKEIAGYIYLLQTPQAYDAAINLLKQVLENDDSQEQASLLIVSPCSVCIAKKRRSLSSVSFQGTATHRFNSLWR